MNRQNLFSDAWDGENEEAGTYPRLLAWGGDPGIIARFEIPIE